MSGAKWICFCGSANIKTIGNSIRPRAVYAKCIDCDNLLRFSKHGMALLRKDINSDLCKMHKTTKGKKYETSRYLANR